MPERSVPAQMQVRPDGLQRSAFRVCFQRGTVQQFAVPQPGLLGRASSDVRSESSAWPPNCPE
eukprot:2900660-Pyramimonas_sp.AAC.1